MIEMNFVKLGKGNVFYKCWFKNFVCGMVIFCIYKGGDFFEEVDVEEIDC